MLNGLDFIHEQSLDNSKCGHTFSINRAKEINTEMLADERFFYFINSKCGHTFIVDLTKEIVSCKC